MKQMAVDEEVLDLIKKRAWPGDGLNRSLRRILGLVVNIKHRQPWVKLVQSEHGTYAYLAELQIGQSTTLPWIYVKGLETEAANARALHAAVYRVQKKSGIKVRTASSINGLIVTRTA